MPSTVYVAICGEDAETFARNAETTRIWLAANRARFSLPEGHWDICDTDYGFEVRIPGLPITPAREAGERVARALYKKSQVKDAQLNPLIDRAPLEQTEKPEKSGTPNKRLGILQILYGSSGSLTTNHLSEAVGATRQSVIGHLKRLVAAGLVQEGKQQIAKQGPPSGIYWLTPAGRNQGPNFEAYAQPAAQNKKPHEPGAHDPEVLRYMFAQGDRSVTALEIANLLHKTRQTASLALANLVGLGLTRLAGNLPAKHGVGQSTYRLTAAGLAHGPDFNDLRSVTIQNSG